MPNRPALRAHPDRAGRQLDFRIDRDIDGHERSRWSRARDTLLTRHGSHACTSRRGASHGAHRLAEDRCADALTRTRARMLERGVETSEADLSWFFLFLDPNQKNKSVSEVSRPRRSPTYASTPAHLRSRPRRASAPRVSHRAGKSRRGIAATVVRTRRSRSRRARRCPCPSAPPVVAALPLTDRFPCRAKLISALARRAAPSSGSRAARSSGAPHSASPGAAP